MSGMADEESSYRIPDALADYKTLYSRRSSMQKQPTQLSKSSLFPMGDNGASQRFQGAHPVLSRRRTSPVEKDSANAWSKPLQTGSPRSMSTRPHAPVRPRPNSTLVGRSGQDLISFHRQSCRLFQSLEDALGNGPNPDSTKDQSHLRLDSISNSLPKSSCVIKTDNGFAYLTSVSSMPRFGGSPRSSRRNSSTVNSRSASYSERVHPFSSSSAAAKTAKASSASSFAWSSSSSLAGTSMTSATTPDQELSTQAHHHHDELELIGKHYTIASTDHLQTSPPPTQHLLPTVSWWTSPETRRLEYEKIDREHKGARGLWKKVMPRWFWGGTRRSGFYDDDDNDPRRRNDDDDDDNDGRPSWRVGIGRNRGGGGGGGGSGGSVRRYRMDLDPEIGTEKEEGQQPTNKDQTILRWIQRRSITNRSLFRSR